ncbi:MAG: hypothetical protein ACOC1F_02900, partial [Myxococcota bacterium]
VEDRRNMTSRKETGPRAKTVAALLIAGFVVAPTSYGWAAGADDAGSAELSGQGAPSAAALRARIEAVAPGTPLRAALPVLRALGFDDRPVADPAPNAGEVQKGTIVRSAFLSHNFDPDPELEHIVHIEARADDGPGSAMHLHMIAFVDSTASRLVPAGTHAIRFGTCSARYEEPESTLTVAPFHDSAYADAKIEWRTGPTCDGPIVSQSGLSVVTMGRGRLEEIARHPTNLVVSNIDGKVIDEACSASRSSTTPAMLIFSQGNHRKRVVGFDAQRYRYPLPNDPCSASPSAADEGMSGVHVRNPRPTAQQRADEWTRGLPVGVRSKVKENALGPFVVASYEKGGSEMPHVTPGMPVEVILVASERGVRVFEDACWLGISGAEDVDGDGRGDLVVGATDCLSFSSTRALLLSDRSGQVREVAFAPDGSGHPEWTRHRGKIAVRTTAHDSTGETDTPLVRVFAFDGREMALVVR